MARKGRIQYENAWYHVMNRGAGHRYVLDNTNNNKETFLELLNEIYIKYNIEIHAYCIMDNHYHLLVKTPNANLSDAMKHLQAMYVRIYNSKIKSDGPIFRARYKAILIESDSYLLQVCKYIHRNPIEANIKSGLNYQWSSFSKYTNNKNVSTYLKTDFILLNYKVTNTSEKFYDWHMDNDDVNLINFYRENSNHNFCILKDDSIKDRIKSLKTCTSSIFSLDDIVKSLANYFEISTDDLKKINRGKVNHCKIIFIFIAINIYGYNTAEISHYLGYSKRSFVIRVNVKTRSFFSSANIISYKKIRYNLNYLIKKVAMTYFKK